jgi:hypothetical protein
MLVGIYLAALQVSSIDAGEICVRLKLSSKSDNFEWALVAVYGAAQDAHNPEFLSELVKFL